MATPSRRTFLLGALGTAIGAGLLARTRRGGMSRRAQPMTTYYVSPSGSDGANGLTTATAWRSIGYASGRVYATGDSLLLQGGQTHVGTLIWSTSGTAVARCAIGSYGGGVATISCGDGIGVQLHNCGYVTLSGVAVTGSGVSAAGVTTSTGTGIDIYSNLTSGAKYASVWVRACTVSGCHDGIVARTPIASGSVVGYSDLQITTCTVHDCLVGGIYIWGSATSSGSPWFFPTGTGTFASPYFAYNHIYNIYGDPSPSIVLIALPMWLFNSTGLVAEYNVVNDCGQAGSSSATQGGIGGLVTFESDGAIVRYNECYHMRSNIAVDGCAFDPDGGCTNNIYEYNYSHDNDGAGYQTGTYTGSSPNTNNIFRYNVSRNDCRKVNQASFLLFGGTNTLVYNNSFYADRAIAGAAVNAALIYIAAGTCLLYNNIFQTTGSLVLVRGTGGSGAFAGNLYWPSGGTFNVAGFGSLASWQATGQEHAGGPAVGLQADPALLYPLLPDVPTLPVANVATITAFMPRPNSPVIGAGLDLLALFGIDAGPIDFRGTPQTRSAGRDIGAVTYVPAPQQLPVG